MKMLKKLLAVVLTGAMALTLFTACGSNAVRDKDIADVMSDMAKVTNKDVTFTPRAKEREWLKNLLHCSRVIRRTIAIALSCLQRSRRSLESMWAV